MRERNEQAGRRPGNMQEQPDAIPHAVRAKPFAKRQEMIILHPDDVLLLDQRIKAVRELLVDAFITARSEEHTSELQSLMRISYAVFCLKKKNNDTPDTISYES